MFPRYASIKRTPRVKFMTKFLSILLLLFTCIQCSSRNGVADEKAAFDLQKELKLEFALDSMELVPYEPVYAVITLTNISNHDLVLSGSPKAFSVNISSGKKNGGEKYLVPDCWEIGCTIWPSRRLKPGQYERHNVRLSRNLPYTMKSIESRFFFDQPGDYQIKFFFVIDSGFKQSNSRGSGSNYWVAEVESQPIDIKVINPNSDDQAIASVLKRPENTYLKYISDFSDAKREVPLLEQLLKDHPAAHSRDFWHLQLGQYYRSKLLNLNLRDPASKGEVAALTTKAMENLGAVTNRIPALRLRALNAAAKIVARYGLTSSAFQPDKLANELEARRGDWWILEDCVGQGLFVNGDDDDDDTGPGETKTTMEGITKTLKSLAKTDTH